MKINIIKTNIFIFIILTSLLFTFGCKKENEWLSVKSSKNSVVPETLPDFQALLDNSIIRNINYLPIGLIGTDDFYLNDANFDASSEYIRNLYIWNKQVTGDEDYFSVWGKYYTLIEYANVVLEGLTKIETVSSEYKNIKGQALFFRALSYYNLGILFCNVYSKTSANTDLGLPLRLSSDVNLINQRSPLVDVYKQILSDAQESSQYLLEKQPNNKRPIRAAAFALLAKTYLNMADYNNAKINADLCLNEKPDLLDFNNSSIVNLSNVYRFPEYGINIPEILFYAMGVSAEVGPQSYSTGLVSKDLYDLYPNEDLRKTILFYNSGTEIKYRGTYTGTNQNFCGLATNEIYLIRAECNARLNNISKAIDDLNTLHIHRYKVGTAPLLSISNAAEALQIVLNERRKELAFVGNIRWEDLKRLNQEASLQKSLKRNINNETFILPPNDKRYILPIPTSEINLSGIKQNER